MAETKASETKAAAGEPASGFVVTEATDKKLLGQSFDTLPGDNSEIALADGTRFQVLRVRPIEGALYSVSNGSQSMVWRDRSVKQS